MQRHPTESKTSKNPHLGSMIFFQPDTVSNMLSQMWRFYSKMNKSKGVETYWIKQKTSKNPYFTSMRFLRSEHCIKKLPFRHNLTFGENPFFARKLSRELKITADRVWGVHSNGIILEGRNSCNKVDSIQNE